MITWENYTCQGDLNNVSAQLVLKTRCERHKNLDKSTVTEYIGIGFHKGEKRLEK